MDGGIEKREIMLSHTVGSFSDPVLSHFLFAVTIYSSTQSPPLRRIAALHNSWGLRVGTEGRRDGGREGRGESERGRMREIQHGGAGGFDTIVLALSLG